jgi:hypothetical protein
MAFGCPPRPAGVVIDDDHQILVAAPERDLIDPDPCQPIERIRRCSRIGDDPTRDRAGGAPRDPHQFHHRGPRGASASTNTFVVPAHTARHRRRPSPAS